MNRVIVSNPFVGLCYMQVCAVEDATDEEILQVCNSENPSGTSGGWSEVIREGSKYEEDLYPVYCKDPSTKEEKRKHFIAVC